MTPPEKRDPDDVFAGFVGNAERRTELGGAAAERQGCLGLVGMALLLVVIGPPALLFRLLSTPWRPSGGSLEAAAARESAERKALHDKLKGQNARVRATPDDVDARFDRGVTLLTEAWSFGQAERDFDRCVTLLDTGEPPGATEPGPTTTLAAALHHRGLARQRLGLSELADVDFDRARALGREIPLPSPLLGRVLATWALARAIAWERWSD